MTMTVRFFMRLGSSAVFKTYCVKKQDIIKFVIADFQWQNLVVVVKSEACYYKTRFHVSEILRRRCTIFFSILQLVSFEVSAVFPAIQENIDWNYPCACKYLA